MNRLLFILLCCHVLTLNAQDFQLDEWTEKWNNSKAYSLELLESFPEDSLHFKPTTDQMDAHAQFRHIVGNMYFLTDRFLDYQPEGFDAEQQWTTLRDTTLSKAQLADLITKGHAFAQRAVEKLVADNSIGEETDFFTGPRPRRVVAWLLQDHVTHHRGQVIVYARLLGLKPPRYRGW